MSENDRMSQIGGSASEAEHPPPAERASGKNDDATVPSAARELNADPAADLPDVDPEVEPQSASQYAEPIGPTPPTPPTPPAAAGSASDSPPGKTNRRRGRRFGFHRPIALILLDPNGLCRSPLVLPAQDLGSGGLCLRSAFMIHPETTGAVQMIRADGSTIIKGVVVRWCRYMGEMMHLVGLAFDAIPPVIYEADFLDEHGRSVLFDPRWLALWGQDEEAA
jgi:hypothetical protein